MDVHRVGHALLTSLRAPPDQADGVHDGVRPHRGERVDHGVAAADVHAGEHPVGGWRAGRCGGPDGDGDVMVADEPADQLTAEQAVATEDQYTHLALLRDRGPVGVGRPLVMPGLVMPGCPAPGR
ncbi:hypothetical protein FRAHR75_30060 [Frankia sp. Hr75.2]|nr:hypothetical protein FRAHR75_30060 [Frankia sp. Hr75.2]